MADGASERIRVNRTLSIAASELQWRFGPSGGPGGQHANTSNTRAEVRFDVTRSPSLRPEQRRRLLDKLGPEVRASASDERSQVRNRAVATQRLVSTLAAALHQPRPRRATRPSRGAVERRLSAKRQRSQRKADRRRPTGED
ncbi:MAG: aminoacyl-tRNA hydrolase [Acidimicrobiia bacterium]|nr:aminoacyl-tRNA hydrolase [Acidimicrobiia bacterium]